jgi:thioesterase domain-containing protein
MDDSVGGRIRCMITTPLSDDIPSWVVPLRAAGTRPPLFCVCGGGGDPLAFREFALALPHDQPIYSFEIPPLGRAGTFPTVAQLATAYVDVVHRLQRHGPYYLCGHSFGGLVAYEMAALLASRWV